MKKAKLHKLWKRQREQVKRDLKIAYTYSGVPGTESVIATIPDMPRPVGVVYYQITTPETVTLLGSRVDRWARRLGVRSAIHAEMLRGYPGYDFVTGKANAKSRPWLKKHGFKKTRNGWFLKGDRDA